MIEPGYYWIRLPQYDDEPGEWEVVRLDVSARGHVEVCRVMDDEPCSLDGAELGPRIEPPDEHRCDFLGGASIVCVVCEQPRKR